MGERQALSLREGLAQAPDPRWPRGRRHPLAAILALAVCAMLGGCRSLYAIAQWGRGHSELAQALGFTREQTSGAAPLHPAFRRLAGAAFEDALSQGSLAALPAEGAVLAGDGKALRGLHGDELPGVRLVAAYAVDAGLVAGQKGGKEPAQSQGIGRRAGIAGRLGFGRQGSHRRRFVGPAGFEPRHRGRRRGLAVGAEKQPAGYPGGGGAVVSGAALGRDFSRSSAGKPARRPAGAALAADLYRLATLAGLARSSAGLLLGARPEPAVQDDGRMGVRQRQFAPGAGGAAAAAAAVAGALGHCEPAALGAGCCLWRGCGPAA